MKVGQLEQKLFEVFPATDAECWDCPGLVTGDRSEEVAAVAFNLDMTIDSVCKAKQAGCNVLVTHHPAYIGEGPSEFGPASQVETPSVGRVIYEDPIYHAGGFTNNGGIDWWSRRDVKKKETTRPLNYLKDHNPQATHHWDKAAEQAGQKDLLIADANRFLRR